MDYYHRGKREGSKLLARIIEIAKRKDREKTLFAVTHQPDFLRRFGFVKVDKFPEELRDKIDRVCVLDKSRMSVMAYKTSAE